MSTINNATIYRLQFIKAHPQLKPEVDSYFELMLDEIEEGNSIANEVQHFISACEDLLTEEE